MSREYLDYTQRRAAGAATTAVTDDLIAGFYRIRRGAGAVYRPVAIWFGPPVDPETDEELDRSPRWQILFCGRFIWDQTLVWPYCSAERIDLAEYEYLLERVLHAREHDPRDPFGTAHGRVDWLKSSPPF